MNMAYANFWFLHYLLQVVVRKQVQRVQKVVPKFSGGGRIRI